MIPTARNGWRYRATTGGTAGLTEPVWPTALGEQVTDGDIVWQNAGTDTVALEEERFPLVIPPSVTLTTADCPAGGGSACQPSNYTLGFGATNEEDQTLTAVSLSQGSVLSGFSVVDEGSMSYASAVECSEGSATVEDVWLLGDGEDPGLSVGLLVQQSCSLTVKRSVLGLLPGAGLVSKTSGDVLLEGVHVGSDGSRPPLCQCG